MISFIKGEVIAKEENLVSVLTKSGVGYEVFVGSNTAIGLTAGDKVEFHTSLRPKDKAMELYGFDTIEEKIFFKKLTSVSGVGPKSAFSVLDLGSMNEIKSAIVNEDKEYLKKVKGVGKKTAGRMIIELQSKIDEADIAATSSTSDQDKEKVSEVVSALTSMGYSSKQASRAVKGVDTEDRSVQDILKDVLKNM